MNKCKITGSDLKECFVWNNFPMSNTCTTSTEMDDVFYGFGLGISVLYKSIWWKFF